jgi:hypothetical protein
MSEPFIYADGADDAGRLQAVNIFIPLIAQPASIPIEQYLLSRCYLNLLPVTTLIEP